MRFSEFLKRRRKELELSQAKLADLLSEAGFEISSARVGHWETERNRAPLEDPEFRTAISYALQISETELLSILGYDVNTQLHTREGLLAAQIVDTLPEEKRELAINLLKDLQRYFQ